MNVFPRFEDYVNAFARLIQNIEPGGTLIYCDQDENPPATGLFIAT